MKYIFVGLTLLIAFTFACKKEKSQGQIISKTLEIPLLLHPVDSFQSSNQCAQNIPFPSDSSVSTLLDINQDGTPDYRITYTNSYKVISSTNPCANYNSQIELQGISAHDQIIVSEQEYSLALRYQTGDKINKNQALNNKAYIFKKIADTPNYLDLNGEGFIGVKLANGSLGWIQTKLDYNTFTLSIQAFAYNTDKDKPIHAGTTE